MNGRSYSSAGYIARLGVLLAVVVVLTILNVGNIPVGPVVATIYQTPVIIGAVLLGVGAGCILGGAWGVLCFYLAATGQTTDVVALAAVQQNAILYFLIAFVPRLLTGLFPGLLYAGLSRLVKNKKSLIPYAVTGVVGSLCNTVFYLGALYLFIRELLASLFGLEPGAVGAMVLGVAYTNGLVEAALSGIIVAAVCRALNKANAAQGGGAKK